MRHAVDCHCVNCDAKESPIQEIWLRDVTVEALSTIEIFDWLEGYGQVMSLAGQKLIRKYGFMLIKAQDEIRELRELRKVRTMNENEKGNRCLGEKADTPQELDVVARMSEAELRKLELQNDLLDLEVRSARISLTRDEALIKAEQRGS